MKEKITFEELMKKYADYELLASNYFLLAEGEYQIIHLFKDGELITASCFKKKERDTRSNNKLKPFNLDFKSPPCHIH